MNREDIISLRLSGKVERGLLMVFDYIDNDLDNENSIKEMSVLEKTNINDLIKLDARNSETDGLATGAVIGTLLYLSRFI